MGLVSNDNAVPCTTLQVENLGEFFEADVLAEPIYDPNRANMRR
jgi:dimethylglycine dehydrogenase